MVKSFSQAKSLLALVQLKGHSEASEALSMMGQLCPFPKHSSQL